MQESVVQFRLAQGGDDLLLDFIHVIDEGVVAKALERALLDELLARARSYTEGVHALAKAALACDKLYDLLSVPDSAIGEQVDMRSLTVTRLATIKNLGERFIDLRASEVGLKGGDLIDGEAHILVVVIDTALIEHELVARAVAADVEFAACRKTVKEQDEGFASHLDGLVHGSTAVDEEDVLLAAQVLHVIVLLLRLKGFFSLGFILLLLVTVAVILDVGGHVKDALILSG